MFGWREKWKEGEEWRDWRKDFGIRDCFVGWKRGRKGLGEGLQIL